MNKNLLGIYLVTSLSMAGVFTLAPALPGVAIALHISAAQVSYILAAFTLGNVLVAPFIGLVADRYGRKRVVVPSLYIFGVAGFCSGMADTLNAVMLWRFVQGMGAAALGTLSVAMIADLFEGRERVRYFGYNMAVNSLGMVLFPLLGGALVLESWRYPFFVSAIAIPIALYMQLFVNITEKLSSMNARSYLSHLLYSLRDKRVLLAAYLNFTTFIMLGGAFLAFYALLIKERFPAEMALLGMLWERELVTAAVVSVFSVAVGVVSAKLGSIHQWLGFNRALGLAFLLYAIALYVFQSVTSLVWLMLATILLGFAHGMVLPSIVALFTKLAPEGMTASYVGFNSLVFRLGQTAGPLLMAWVYTFTGELQSVFLLAAVLALPAAVIAFVTPWRKESVST